MGVYEQAEIRRIVRGENVEETITEQELEEAMVRKGWQLTAERAASIFADIKRHREPEWQEGDLVRDADGFVWARTGDGWGKPKGGGSGHWGHGFPTRPLKKLVEE